MTKKQKRLAIFGCGYVGKDLAMQALKLGYEVVALTHNVSKAEELKRLGVDQVVVASLHRDNWYREIRGNFESVVNCVSSSGGGIAGYQQSYRDGQRSLLEWSKNREIGNFLYTSSTTVYPHDHGDWVTEDSSLQGISKSSQIIQQSEQILWESRSQFGRVFILRLAGIYGPSRHYLLDQIKQGQRTLSGSGDHYLNLIFLNDICRAIWGCLDANPTINHRIYNLSDGHPFPKKLVAQYLSDQFGGGEPIAFDPEKPLFSGSVRRVNNRKVSNRKICQELEWEPQYPDYQSGYQKILEIHKS